jgi:hypothetical protein
MIIKLTVDRFEGEGAVLVTADNEKIIWPRNKLPENLNEGSTVTFVVAGGDSETGNKLAKDILNEILNDAR